MRSAAKTSSSTSIRLRAMVLPTCSSSVQTPRGPSRRAASTSAAGSASGEQLGCGPFGTTVVRSAAMPAVATSASRVAWLSQAMCPALRRPARMCRVIALNQRGPRLDLRIEDAAERVEIVARHDRPLRRQPVDQLGVAVIDDVKEVEAAAEAGDVPRVVPEAVGDAIESRQPGQRAAPRHAAGAAVQHRPDERRRDTRPHAPAAVDRRACRRRGPCSATPLPGSRQ